MRLDNFVLKASSDPAKADLELRCDTCGEPLCDAESGDSLEVLGSVAESHAAGTGHGS
ncbi:hypothetical protein H7J07_05265 [Mycobacterium koreense]|uniref:hypothetical protein n=1 Tax=Mycolicibacillus koreensis TaxID=1069220 RepID=UPI00138C5D49|nr:hypothetical protein [Mycolicibacillus koreensis]MCV7247633.1 hypothetical protein [Mycolicibacillus koreensis]BBY54014.1 hypothetical protein MKOR_12650 [Mycolicibacillus koreensis]